MKTCPPVCRLSTQPGLAQAPVLPNKKASSPASVLKSILLLSGALVLPAAAIAGSTGGAASNHKVGVVINEGSSSWNVDMSGILTYNAETGALSMPAFGATLGAGWEWAQIAIPSSEQTVQGLKWHTAERNEDDSAWRSTFTFTATGNVDPFMNYVFSAKNNTTVAQTYTFTYGEALIPAISGLYDVYADISGGLTNGTPGAGTVKIIPTISDSLGDNDGINEIQILRLSTDGGFTFVNAGVDVGLGQETATTSTYGVYADSLTATATTPFNSWEITTQFTLSPGRDTAVFTGSVVINPSEASIPEPSTYAVLVGALALGFAALKRRSAFA